MAAVGAPACAREPADGQRHAWRGGDMIERSRIDWDAVHLWMAQHPPGSAQELEAARRELDRFVERQKRDKSNPDSVRAIGADIDALVDQWRGRWFVDDQQGGHVRPGLSANEIGGVTQLTKALYTIAQSGQEMGLAYEKLQSAMNGRGAPDQIGALREEKEKADTAVDKALFSLEPLHGAFLNGRLAADLRKAGWDGLQVTGPGPSGQPQSHVDRLADSQDPQAQDYVGSEKAQTGDLAGADQAFSKALAIDPRDIDALNGRGQVRLRAANYDGAAGDARTALEVEPGNAVAKETLRYATASLGQDLTLPNPEPRPADDGWVDGSASAAGASGLRPAITAEVAQSAGLARTAFGYLKVKDFERAGPLLDQAIGLDPKNADALGQRAAVNVFTGRYAEAVQDMLAGLQASPAQADNALAVARELNRRGRYQEARDLTLALLRSDPNDASAHFELSRAEAGLGDRGGALEDLRQAAALDPGAYRAKLAAAQAAAEGQDLSFLFDEPREGAAAQDRAGRAADRKMMGMVILSVVGGFIVALGLLHVILSWRNKQWVGRVETALAAREGAAAEARSEPEASRLAASYEVVRQLGVGGMGVVYEAGDRGLGRHVAIKKMRDEIRADPRERERFLKEARTVAALHHPGIVAIHSIEEDGDDVYLVFEYVDGETLHHLIERRDRLGLEEAAGLVLKAAEALAYAHDRGVVHRALKPSNIMVAADGTVKVMDFGVARQAKDAASRHSVTGSIVGTPPYMAPEQEQGLVCRESDIYALAVCFYELLTGWLPFQGSAAGMLMNKMKKSYASPSGLAPGLPAAVDALFATAFEPDPARRFHTVEEFAGALRQAAALRADVP